MSIKQYFKRAISLPPHVVALKVFQLLSFWAMSQIQQLRDRFFGTFSQHYSHATPRAIFDLAPSREEILSSFPELPPLLDKTLSHHFDLLGSGWVHVHHQMRAAGVGGHQYPPVAGTAPVPQQFLWIDERINPSNQKQAYKIWKQVSLHYEPIDWHLDFKSGFRWNESTWWARVPYGHKPGVDVKVPWEISRAQHLPWLSFGFASDKDLHPARAAQYLEEFQNQILDFIANNPPRYGVNWRCAMDVAIRAANWVISYEFFRLYGGHFKKEFVDILLNSLHDHGDYIFHNLEIGKDGFRGNHYLADICGLAHIASFLPKTEITEEWLRFSYQALITEMDYQFFDDGANFEGSTAYHRLSAEMMLYTTLLFKKLSHKPEYKGAFDFGKKYLDKLKGMADFARAITRPDHNISQVGDCDSGRFFKLQPLFKNQLVENHQTQSCLIEGIEALFTTTNAGLTLEAKWLQRKHVFTGSHVHVSIPHTFSDKAAMQKHLPSAVASELQKVFAHPGAPFAHGVTSMQTHRVAINSHSPKKTLVYHELGLTIWKSEDFYLGFRCGPVGQKNRGGHDHNDQLSLELFSEGSLKIADPGTAIYTPLPKVRNAYRSIKAHFAPQVQNEQGQIIEPGPLDQGLFSLNGQQRSYLLCANEHMMAGYNPKLRTLRVIFLREKELEVVDVCFESKWKLLPQPQSEKLSYSEGYGLF